MATRRESLEVGIVATDKASKILGDVATQVDKLDGETASVAVTAEDKASEEIDLLLQAVSRLDAQDAEVVLTARADDFNRDIKNVLKQIGRVKEQDHLNILIDAKNEAQAKLEAVNSAIAGLDTGATVTLTADDQATTVLEGVQSSLDAGGTYADMAADVVIDADDNASAKFETVDTNRQELTTHKADVEVTASDHASSRFEAIDTNRKELDRLSADVTVTADTSQATLGLDGVYTAADGIDRKLNGSDQSGSVFANFAGNAAQELPGVAGSFGPLNMAISQFVEYSSEGNIQMGGLLKSGVAMAIVGGTFAAIGSGVKLLGEQAKKSAKNVANIRESMDDLNVSAADFLETVQSNQDMLKITEDITVGWDDYVNTLQEIVHIGDGFQDIDVAQIFDKADISLSRFSRAVTGTMDDVGQMEADLLLAREQGTISQDEYSAAIELTEQALQNVRDAEREAAAEAKAFAVDTDTASAALEDIVNKSEGMSQFGSDWSKLVADVADGTVDFESSAAAINMIAEATGKTSEEIEQMAWDEATQGAKDAAEASDEAAASLEDNYIAALEHTNDVLDESIDKLSEMADAQLSVGDAALEVRDKQRRVAASVENYTKIIDENSDSNNKNNHSANEVAEALDGVVTSVAASADAQRDAAQATAAANGVTMTESQLLDQKNTALLNSANLLEGPMRDAVLGYIADINGIPPETVAQIRAALERHDITEANRLLQQTSKTRTTLVKAEADQRSIDATNAKLDLVARTRTAHVVAKYGGIGEYGYYAYARGTPSARPGMALVGEQGPELVQMAGGEQVHTAGETRSMLNGNGHTAGTTVNYFYYPSGYSSRGVTNANRRYERIQGPS